MKRWIEFVEGNGRRLSMSRLLVFLAFWPACWALLNNPSESMMGIFLGAFVANYIGGKSADIFMGNEKLAADSDSDTVSDTAVTSHVVEKRSVKSTGPRKRPF